MSPLPATSGPVHVLVVGTADWARSLADSLDARADVAARTEPSVDDAIRDVSDGSVDCVVSGYDLDGSTGVQLVRSIREVSSTVPVVLCTDSGSEAIASEAIAAGVTDYVPLSGELADEGEALGERVLEHVRSADRAAGRLKRAHQFDAIFHDTRTATWVLDPGGSFERANRTAHELLAGEVEHTDDADDADDADDSDDPVDRDDLDDLDDLGGDPFWTLPWWSRPGRLSADVRQLVERATAGEFSHAVVARPSGADDRQLVELSAYPVLDDRDDVVSVVVEGVDITERVALERELRRSEELHRVTLNNMTDTVLITDDEGEYTYVCPNVHFIFGYTAAEIRELGTIDALLGEDLFDRDELAEEGVLKNIECRVTDRAGRDHTLLVNVREVSIQDGTILYSCRDVTKRKQREEALAALQEIARDFLYAETRGEIARQLVADVPDVLELDASGVYLFDTDGNELRPVAQSAAMERLNGPLPAIAVGAGGLVGHSFVEDETLFLDDVHDSPRLENRATDLRSAAYIPLGDHGVFVAGTDAVGRFDEVTRELADLLAATAEAALDRVERESELRAQERELQRRNAELSGLNRINEIIREIDQALVRAETREEVERAVCDRLTADDRFAFAWIGVVDGATGTVEPRAWAGEERGYLDDVPREVAESGAEPAGRTAATGDVTKVDNAADGLRREPWRKEAAAREFLSALSVPVAYDEFTYGVLTVYSEERNAFDRTAQEVLSELGETMASATSAIERKNALLTRSVTRVEVDVDDPSFVLSRLARETGCTLTYQGGIQQTADGCYVFVTVAGADVAAVEGAATDLVAIDEVERISATGEEAVLRLHLTEPFLALELADHGAVLRSATVDPDVARLVVDVPESVENRHVVGLLTETFSDVDLRSKGTVDRSPGRTDRAAFLDRLTDRQLEVLQTAYYSGYFESPRESTGEEVAEALDISPQAFYQHTRTVQHALFSTLFDDFANPASLPPRP